MSVEINRIRLDGGTQSRAAINEATVAEYVEAMGDENTVFPPITVYFDGRDYWLADGFHRLEAWRRIGRTDIPADVRQGDRRRAILHSVAANSAHGLRRSNEDKRRAVLTLLEDAEWSQWSDREIARRCAVSHPFVANLRASLTGNVSSDDATEVRAYTTKHGTATTMNTANIGSGPNPDQKSAPPQQAEHAGEKADQAHFQHRHTEPDQIPAEPDAPAEDTETAKARRALAKLTREALEDEVLGLRAEVAERKARGQTMKAEIDALKEKLREATAEDLGAAVGRLQRRLDQANYARDEAMKTAKREEFKRVQAEKRVAELQAMGVEIPV